MRAHESSALTAEGHGARGRVGQCFPGSDVSMDQFGLPVRHPVQGTQDLPRRLLAARGGGAA